MTQQTSPFVEAKYGWEYGESGWNSGMDENLLKFSFLFDGTVDGIVSSLPAAVSGQAYFLNTDNRLYFSVRNTWYSSSTPKWHVLTIKSSGATYQFNGTVLSEISTNSSLQSRVATIEATLSTLGSAAFENTAYFASSTQLEVANSQNQAYTDSSVNTYKALLLSSTGATIVGRGASTVAEDLTSVESRITTLETNPSNTIGFATSPAEETARFAEGYSFVLRTDLILPAPPPVPTYTLDANIYTGNTTTGPFQGSGVGGGYYELAFSFTAVATGVLGRIELPVLYSSGTASDFTIELRADVSGLPGGSVLDSANLGAFTSPTTAAGALAAPRVATFAFNQVAGTKYWMCMRVLTPASNSVYSIPFTGSGNGNLAARNTAGGAWTKDTTLGNGLYRNYRVTYE